MKFTVTLTLDVDEQAYANHYLGGEVREPGVPTDVLRGDVSLGVAAQVRNLVAVDVVAVTDQPASGE